MVIYKITRSLMVNNSVDQTSPKRETNDPRYWSQTWSEALHSVLSNEAQDGDFANHRRSGR